MIQAMKLFLFLLFCAAAFGQTTVSLRSSGPIGGYITGATIGPPMVLTIACPYGADCTTGLNVGDKIGILGVCANDPTHNYLSNANGQRKIKAWVVPGSQFSITDTSDVDITGNGAWCTGAFGDAPGGVQLFGKLNDFPLIDQPRGWFDGPTGTITREWALGTANGLTSFVVDGSHVATVTTDYSHGLTAGKKLNVWGTTDSTLNNGPAMAADYTVATADATHFTFTVPSSIPAGDYTHNDVCGPGVIPNETIQGGRNCVLLSQTATLSNPYWSTSLAQNLISTRHYMSVGDDASGFLGLTDPYAVAESWAYAGLYYLLDQSNSSALSAVMYILNNVERGGGAGFYQNEDTDNHGGSTEIGDVGAITAFYLTPVITAGSGYLTPAHLATLGHKLYNNIDDAGSCTKPFFLRKTLATGTAQAGDATHITLAAGDAHGDGYYVNNEIIVPVGGGGGLDYGLVTAYDSTTKVATVSSWVNGGVYGYPTTGTTYTIFATISRSGTTITGYNTTFESDVAAGDVVYGGNRWHDMNAPSRTGTYVTSVASDTSLNGRNGDIVYADATPRIFWYASHAIDFDTACGFRWAFDHWDGSLVQPISFPMTGGGSAAIGPTTQAQIGSNNAYTNVKGWISMDLAMADITPKAVSDLTRQSINWFDNLLPITLSYWTGFSPSGNHYQWARPFSDAHQAAGMLQQAVIGYPSMDLTGVWNTAATIAKMYVPFPDHPYVNFRGERTQFMVAWGAIAGDYLSAGGQAGNNYFYDGASRWAPTSNAAKYFRDWLSVYKGAGRIAGDTNADKAITLNPNNPTLDHTSQPKQYAFKPTSFSACTALYGTCPFPSTMRGDAMISRSGWSSLNDSLLFLRAASYIGDHDNPQPVSTQLYKAGFLLGGDNLPIGGTDGTFDATKNDFAFEFGGANSLITAGRINSPGIAQITRWSSANHGSWDAAYGDQDSNYACVLADLAGAYTTIYNRVWRYLCHFKKPGTEEIVVQYDDVDVTGHATAIRNQIHYPQNGETMAAIGWNFYDEGTTDCPSDPGCASINTGRTILEQENGGTSSGDPDRKYNLITRILSPGTITVRWDGSAYTGANGHTDRVSLCGGSSCGSTVSTLEDVIVHKVATQPDTTLTTAALNPDANWTGVQTADKVVLFARGGATHSTMAGFTTTHSGTAQYLFAGLTAGTYAVTVGGNAVTGSPFTVGANDNTIYFESTAGTISVNGSVAPCAITTTFLPGGTVGAGYSQTIQTANCATPVSWAIAAGSLCGGLSIEASTGEISGNPTTAQTCNFTVQATDHESRTASQVLIITVTGGVTGVQGIAAISGGTAVTAGSRKQ